VKGGIFKMNKKNIIATAIMVMFVSVLLVSVVAAKPNPRAAKACRDGLDNDGDGYTDYPDDPGCASKNDISELNPEIECDDGTDNDGDGDTDYPDDGGCSSPIDNDETDCGDGVCEGGETSGTCPADCPIPDSCGDTDGGNYPLVFGTTSGYFDNSPYDSDDYCIDTSNIMEYYCTGDYENNSQQSCGTDGYGADYCIGDSVYQNLTDYFCGSGECDSTITPEFQEDCDTSDGYGADYCINASIYKDYNDYFCSGGSCDFGATPEFVEDCDSYDSYSGNYCSGDDVYRDFYDFDCSGGGCYNATTPELVENCSYGCTGGVCDPIPDSCSDTDGGDLPLIFGTTSGFFNESPFSTDDYCVDTSNIMEYYCTGDYEQSSQQSCGTDGNGADYCISDSVYQNFTDYFCGSGACDSNTTPIFQEDCNDNDGYGADYCINSSIYKDYNDYFCSGGSCDFGATPEFVEDCDASDGYGADYCLSGNVYKDYNDYFCSGGSCDFSATPEWVESCSYGCTNGTCDPIPDSCMDSDGGFYFEVYGNVTGSLNEQPYLDLDYCLNNETLIEQYCSGNYAYNYTTSCATNTTSYCSSGVCL